MPESAAQTSRAQDYSSVLAKLASALSNGPSTKAFTTSMRLLRESSAHFDWGVLGEIDIDSSQLSAFNQNDREILERAASILARHIEGRSFVSHEPSAL